MSGLHGHCRLSILEYIFLSADVLDIVLVTSALQFRPWPSCSGAAWAVWLPGAWWAEFEVPCARLFPFNYLSLLAGFYCAVMQGPAALSDHRRRRLLFEAVTHSSDRTASDRTRPARHQSTPSKSCFLFRSFRSSFFHRQILLRVSRAPLLYATALQR